MFDARKLSPALRRATKAYTKRLLKDLLPPLRLAARGSGYAIAVHGSLARDLDLVAIPWEQDAEAPEELLNKLCGVLAGVLGRATTLNINLKGDVQLTDKPHGRKVATITTTGHVEIDLSIMPRIEALGGSK